MSTTVTVRAVSRFGSVRCPACGAYLPARPEPEVVCTWCGVTWAVE